MGDTVVVLDFVNDIVNENGKVAHFGAPKHVAQQGAVDNAAKVLEAVRSKGLKVIFVKVCFAEGYPELEGVNAPFYAAHRLNGWLQKGTWGTEFDPRVAPLSHEVVLEKSRVNPFSNPALVAELAGVDRIVVMGVTTNFAVEEFVRNGAALGYDILVLEDCCASNNAELHQFSIANIMPKFAKIASSTDYLAGL